ncbi:30S ribosomal protein S2 [bacterium CG10_49_38]|nr:MAG: 30S ribosomal protein S2 [bacterium CG10_49_38]
MKEGEVASQSIKDEQVKRLFDLGAHFGYAKESRHPSTKPFLFGLKNKTVMIDLEKTAESLEGAKTFVRALGVAKKNLIFVGNKKEAGLVIQEAAESVDLPYVTERWIGGTLTNFKEIRKRIDRLVDLRDQEAKGELIKYTKKERSVIAKEVSDLDRYFNSLIGLTKLPGAIFVIDPKKEAIAVAEAVKSKVPVIALANSDCNLAGVDYPIVANDANRQVIKFIAEALAKAYAEGLKEGEAQTAAVTPNVATPTPPTAAV